ncbi:hypothetical protein EV191_109219 [Tamaricihabitans halophyticus]|uniref:Uncharacterized protein n=1 Tax=Tamaricihabitans halophyticus TaxID=1262583 RepID=A0A4R2QJE8_9PSEU|nr:hypothetical protein [Tamaricihabitans halophyticus]TCP49397.1 hypothetical protein EV191_109219 [Tamaricihabitans halophyticus]
MNELWYRILATRVYEYLARVDAFAGPDARGLELRRLTAAWRALLRLHGYVGRRRCGLCAGRGRATRIWLAGKPGSCSVWWVAHAYFTRRLRADEQRDAAQRPRG